MTLIVGLGNPGKSYEQNRHNIGFMVIDFLVGELGASSISKTSFQGDLFKSGDVFLLKPTTYMNLSGKSALAVKQFYKIDHVIVIHDDLDLPFGALRYKQGGGNGGHNGLKSLDTSIGSDYLRVRMGIGKPEHKSMVADYVLNDFDGDEKEKLDGWIKTAAKATLLLCGNPLDEVASKHSQKKL